MKRKIELYFLHFLLIVVIGSSHWMYLCMGRLRTTDGEVHTTSINVESCMGAVSNLKIDVNCSFESQENLPTSVFPSDYTRRSHTLPIMDASPYYTDISFERNKSLNRKSAKPTYYDEESDENVVSKIFYNSNCYAETNKKQQNLNSCCYADSSTSSTRYNQADLYGEKSVSVNIYTGTKPKTRITVSQNMSKSRAASNVTINIETQNRIQGKVKRFEKQWDEFYERYLLWKNERLETISKLQELVKKVHDDQLAFNQTNVMFKELNVNSRTLKGASNPTLDFFASLGTFLTDAASGITSTAQAFNIDGYNAEFKKVMEHDVEITKSLYTARSKCLVEYKDVEEVVRQFHSETLGDTVETISKTLKLEDLWLDLKSADSNGENAVSCTLNSLDKFFSRNTNADVLGKVCSSIDKYVESNPAALDACKSAGKALYGIYDTWGRDYKQTRSISSNTSRIANHMILAQEVNELDQLRSVAHNEKMSQAKLETRISNTIDSLQVELDEIGELANDSYRRWN